MHLLGVATYLNILTSPDLVYYYPTLPCRNFIARFLQVDI
jgi:hypothetical protein